MLSHDEILSSKGSMLIITGLTALVEEEGKTPHEAIEHARKIESAVFFALQQIHSESKTDLTEKEKAKLVAELKSTSSNGK
ncbi:hypothetical protein NST92_05285 [Bacillus sp. FSL R5-0586]|uniref:hypothetical protein n=1 Tax=Bacillus sp. FSL R5-0586 TaxID=2954559 RepID=UPI000301BF7D